MPILFALIVVLQQIVKCIRFGKLKDTPVFKKTMYIQELVNILDYFNERGIVYARHGKNIGGSGDWAGLQHCPFCGDNSFHLGIHLQSKALKCWRCGRHNLFDFILKTENCSKAEVFKILAPFQTGNQELITYQRPVYNNKSVELPEECHDLDDSHKNYLASRNFDPDEIEKKYKVKGTSFYGKWAFRLIIPVYENNKLMTFTSRDITDQQTERYKSCPASKEVCSIKSLLPYRDTVKATGVIVEGCFDAWRIGGGAMPVMGIEYTPQQLQKLKGISRLFILFDSEPQAQEQAQKLAYEASIYVPEVVNLSIPEYKDPASIPPDEIPHLRRELFGKVF